MFVDDAVQGRLPNVCAYDGTPASWRVPVDKQVGGMNPAWLLLIFLGPIGWVVLFFMVFSGTETLGCLVPVCAETVQRWKERRRDRWLAAAALFGTVVLALLARGQNDLLWLLAGVSLVALIATHVRATMGGIGVHLDASRRWVTFTGVADEFAAAVRQQQAHEERYR